MSLLSLDVRLAQITRDWSKDAEVSGGRFRLARRGQNVPWYLFVKSRYFETFLYTQSLPGRPESLQSFTLNELHWREVSDEVTAINLSISVRNNREAV